MRFALAALALLPLCVSFQAGVLPLRQPLPLAGEHVAPRVATTPLGTYMQNVPSLVAARLTFESVIEGVGGSKSFPAVTVTRPGAYGFAAKTNQDAFIVSSAPMVRHPLLFRRPLAWELCRYLHPTTSATPR